LKNQFLRYLIDFQTKIEIMKEERADCESPEENKTPESEVERKLGELMLRGWLMTSECCPIESNFSNINLGCHCPLMRNNDGQIYCVNCESWIIEKEVSSKKQRFGELVTFDYMQDKQKIQLKDQGVNNISSLYTKNLFTFEKHIVTSFQMKLVYLINLLNNESDIFKIE
jgi:uncharacterized Zn finger protein (UPF0148 family)